MGHFMFDVDHTIIDGHTHNFFGYKGISPAKSPEEQEAHFQTLMAKGFSPIGNSAEQWRNLINTLLLDGHTVSIVSFSNYGNYIVPKYLKHIIELDEETLNKIHIESWLPRDNMTANKNLHIQNALAKHNAIATPSEVILIDDSESNIQEAQRAGYRTILATPNANHIQEALDLSKKLKVVRQENSEIEINEQLTKRI